MRTASIETFVSEAAASGWESAATFIVAFEERGRGRARTTASVVLQLVQDDGHMQNIAGLLDETGRVAEVELSGLDDGEYRPTIVASTPDGSFCRAS